MHLACAQGNLEMVQLMYEIQPDAFCECLGLQDVVGMAPLHRAALFDRVECVRFLVEQVYCLIFYISVIIHHCMARSSNLLTMGAILLRKVWGQIHKQCKI